MLLSQMVLTNATQRKIANGYVDGNGQNIVADITQFIKKKDHSRLTYAWLCLIYIA